MNFNVNNMWYNICLIEWDSDVMDKERREAAQTQRWMVGTMGTKLQCWRFGFGNR